MLTAPLAAVAALAMLAACSTDESLDDPSAAESAEDPAAPPADEGEATGEEPAAEGSDEWFDQAVYDTEYEQRSATFEGDAAQPYLQYIDGPMTDTSEYAAEGPHKVCFSNASISNPWRQTGWITMNEQLKVLQESGVISEMETRDAQDDDNTQIADIDYFINEGNCDAFVISPSSTAALTPAVERACDTGLPVVVFDRGVETDCATTFIHPIGGYAWGIDTAEFLVENLQEGDKVVALRILPGVDVLEHRWAAAEKIFSENGIEAVDYFTGADPTEIKKIISDELATGDVQGVWMDAGDGAVAAIEAFEDAGADYPVMTGEDEMSFLRKWDETGLTGLAPVYSNFQWRTPLLAIEKIFAGEEIPTEWVLPQSPITEEERGDFLAANEGMPDGHYAKFGGEDLPGYPQVWQERVIP
ncbi:substrate-binding domain-containing protein [Ornithinimicrobium cavernae]|uniref:substrate-binding domain-containing protein n=1 Tax=Ornithinimicrobium cavernae TaxID=2666047 RepID=UPI001F25FD0B|nr:substrate-binding domain-containing protein [Ornithinimicrobium cavernae]